MVSWLKSWIGREVEVNYHGVIYTPSMCTSGYETATNLDPSRYFEPSGLRFQTTIIRANIVSPKALLTLAVL